MAHATPGVPWGLTWVPWGLTPRSPDPAKPRPREAHNFSWAKTRRCENRCQPIMPLHGTRTHEMGMVLLKEYYTGKLAFRALS